VGRIYDPIEGPWKEIERTGAESVDSHLLLPLEEGGRTRLSITRIAAGGTGFGLFSRLWAPGHLPPVATGCDR